MTKAERRERCERRARVIKALAHPSRVFLAEVLSQGERCVCDLTELVGADMSTVSKHLAIMKRAGLVKSEKRGLQQFYRIACPCLTDFFHCADLVTSGQSSSTGLPCV